MVFLGNQMTALLLVFLVSHNVWMSEQQSVRKKSVLVVILARNEQHNLPLFLYLFEKIKYPKEKISLFIRSDHCVDETNEILEAWLSEHVKEYESVNAELKEEPKVYEDEENGEDFWSNQRRMQVIMHREEGLEEARSRDADFVWFVDPDAFLRNPYVLQALMLEDETVIAPMLTSTTTYANFWGDMNELYWYKRSEDYTSILQFKNVGTIPVARIAKCVLINLNHEDSKKLSFQPSSIFRLENYKLVPVFDYTIFALNARANDIDVNVCNKGKYGNIFAPKETENIVEDEILQISQLGMEHISKLNVGENENSELNDMLLSTSASQTKNLGFDQIYYINLERRPDRKERMEKLLQSFGIEGTLFQAFDWQQLNASFLTSMGISPLETYREADLTLGITGNILSHYYLWNNVVKNNYTKVIIFEDDVNFRFKFDYQMELVIDEIERLDLDWDLVYLGRKVLSQFPENTVYDSEILVKPQYSYWALGYMLSYRGAKKLVDQEPMKKVLPIDEFIPIMCDVHPVDKWSKHFWPRNLKSFAVNPVLIEPMLYYNNEGYVSDTATSTKLADILSLDADELLREDFHDVKMEL